MVTAKFNVSRITPMGQYKEPYCHEIELTPDYAQGRNKEWAEATPYGVIRLGVKNDVAEKHFKLGAKYTVMFDEETE